MTVAVCSLRLPPGVPPAAGVSVRLDAGFEALALEEPLAPAAAAVLAADLPRDAVFSVALFLPAPRGLRPGEPIPYSSAELSPDLRRDAVRHGVLSLEFADRLGARVVRVPPAPADDGMTSNGGGGAPPLRERDAASRRSLSAYLSGLERWLESAVQYDLRLAVEPSADPRGVPNGDDIRVCLAEFRGAPLTLWVPTSLELPALLEDRTPLHTLDGATTAAIEVALEHLDSPTPQARAALRLLLEACPWLVVDLPQAADAAACSAVRDAIEVVTRRDAPFDLFGA